MRIQPVSVSIKSIPLKNQQAITIICFFYYVYVISFWHAKTNFDRPVAELKEFEPRLKSAKTRFKLSAGLNLQTIDTILSGTNHI